MENDTIKQSSNTAVPVEQYKIIKTNGLAIASMVLGIASWVLCSGGGIIAITGLILGLVALNQISKNPEQEGKGMAIAGVILNSISILGAILVMLLYGAYIIALITASAAIF